MPSDLDMPLRLYSCASVHLNIKDVVLHWYIKRILELLWTCSIFYWIKQHSYFYYIYRFPIVEPDSGHTKLRLAREGLEAIERITDPIAAVAVSQKSLILFQSMPSTRWAWISLGLDFNLVRLGLWFFPRLRPRTGQLTTPACSIFYFSFWTNNMMVLISNNKRQRLLPNVEVKHTK